MKKHLLSIIFIFSFLQQSFSQNPLVKQWDKRFGGTSWDYFNVMQQTKEGGFILGGSSKSGHNGNKSQANWDPTNNTLDYWIIKIDSVGMKQWDKRYGGTGNDNLTTLQQTKDGGYILGGYSRSGISGDKTQPCWGVVADFWIVKIDSIGIKQWDKRFGGEYEERLRSLQQTTDGGYILGGYSMSDISGDKTEGNRDTICNPFCSYDYWIVKTDSLGNKEWDRDFGGTEGDFLYSLQQTSDGGYILGGNSASDSSGDKTQNTWHDSINNVTADYWIIKTDALGIKEWDKDLGGTDADWLLSLQQTIDGGYILGGYSDSDSSGDKSHDSWYTIFGIATTDYWMVKTDSIGNKQWDKVLGGNGYENEFGNVFQTSDGGYLLAGISASDSSGDKTENNLVHLQTWVVKTDSLGSKQWDKTLLTDNTPFDYFTIGFAIQISDGCYVMGNYNDAGIGGDRTQGSWGNDDYWIIKFCDSIATTSININSNFQIPFSIYPNPANELLVISDKRTGKKEMEIYDMFGRTVLQSLIFNLQSTIDISKLSPGIYFLKAGNEVRKFVKE